MMNLRMLFLLAVGCLSAAAGEPNLDDPATVRALVKEAASPEDVERTGDAYSGWVRKLYPDGSLHALYECRKGIQHGQAVFWKPDGSKFMEGRFKDGEQMGEWTFWGRNGQTTTRVFTEQEYEDRKQERERRARRGIASPPPHLIAMFDTDGDGKLDEEEAAAFRKSSKLRAEIARARRLEEFDTDGDGKVSPAEQIAPWDADGDGHLSPEERDAYKTASMEKHARKLAADLKRYDHDGDGTVTSEERIAAYDKDSDGQLDAIERADMRRHFEQGR